MEMREYIPTRNVLVAVDVQNDFIDGSLAVTDGEQVVDPINQIARAVRQTMGRVAFTRDWHPSTTPHFDKWPVHCVAETEGAAFSRKLEILPEDIILNKGTGQTDGYSGAEGVSEDGQTLESIIDPEDRWEDVNVYIGGLATDYCVKATAIDIACRFGNHRNVAIFALRDAMRAVNLDPNDEAKAIAEMQSAGVHITTLEDALERIDYTRLER